MKQTTLAPPRLAPRAAEPAPRSLRGLGALVSVLSLLAAACSSSSAGETAAAVTPDGGEPDASTGDPGILAGTFQVRLIAPVPATAGAPESPGSTSVLGKIYDGATPATIVWEKAAEEGDCQLLTPRVPFCNTPCGGSAACVEDDTCQDYPAAHSAGKVTATGIHTSSGEASFTMDPVANNYQAPAGVDLPYPAFDEGDEIGLQASGDYFAAFTLKATGVSPLELLNDTIPLETDQSVSLTWTPPGQAGLSAIHVKLDISHHGGTKGMIVCDAGDTGSLDLPASLVTKLLDLGVAGFPSIIVTREAVGSVTIAPGRVDLVVSASVEKQVVISGITSCSGDADCTDGQTCQSDLTCQ